MEVRIPERLTKECRGSPEATAWLERLPEAVTGLADRWRIAVGLPFDEQEGTCSWVARRSLKTAPDRS